MTNHEKGTIIYQINNVEITKYSLLHTVESMCEMHLFSYEGYRKAVKKYFHFSHLIPIYLSEEIQLISIKRYRDYDNNFINYVAIENYCEFQEGVEISFLSGRKIYIKMSLYNFENQIEKLMKIRNTKVKHFH